MGVRGELSSIFSPYPVYVCLAVVHPPSQTALSLSNWNLRIVFLPDCLSCFFFCVFSYVYVPFLSFWKRARYTHFFSRVKCAIRLRVFRSRRKLLLWHWKSVKHDLSIEWIIFSYSDSISEESTRRNTLILKIEEISAYLIHRSREFQTEIFENFRLRFFF